jgi:hypothetical protein
VLNSLHNITSTGFALGTDHGGTLRDTTESLAEVAAATYERGLEAVFGDVVHVICRSEDFGFVNVVDPNGFEDLT